MIPNPFRAFLGPAKGRQSLKATAAERLRCRQDGSGVAPVSFGAADRPARTLAEFALFKLPSVVTVGLTCTDRSPGPYGPGFDSQF